MNISFNGLGHHKNDTGVGIAFTWVSQLCKFKLQVPYIGCEVYFGRRQFLLPPLGAETCKLGVPRETIWSISMAQ